MHLFGFFIIFFFLICRLEFAVLRMANFYRRNPTLLAQHFDFQNQNRKMHKVSQVVIEGASNPMVQTLALGMASAVVWKALDVYDHTKQVEIAETTNASNERNTQATIESNAKIAQGSRKRQKKPKWLNWNRMRKLLKGSGSGKRNQNSGIGVQ